MRLLYASRLCHPRLLVVPVEPETDDPTLRAMAGDFGDVLIEESQTTELNLLYD